MRTRTERTARRERRECSAARGGGIERDTTARAAAGATTATWALHTAACIVCVPSLQRSTHRRYVSEESEARLLTACTSLGTLGCEVPRREVPHGSC
jgi:hypothetical protein